MTVHPVGLRIAKSAILMGYVLHVNLVSSQVTVTIGAILTSTTLAENVPFIVISAKLPISLTALTALRALNWLMENANLVQLIVKGAKVVNVFFVSLVLL